MPVWLYKETMLRCSIICKVRFSSSIAAFRLSIPLHSLQHYIIRMKILLSVVVLFVAVEAHQGWPFYGPGVGYGRGNKPGRGPWTYPQQQTPNNLFDSDVEWMCQNPKTNDIMIIATDNTRRDYSGRGPWQWQNPSGHQADPHHQQGNQWTQPIIVQREPTNTNNNNNNQLPPLFPQTSETPNNNNNNNNNHDNQPQTTPPYHGGEGLIDIRVAP